MIDRTTVTSTGGAPAFRAIAGVENASGPSDGMAASLVAPGARALAPPAIAIAAGDPAVAGVAFAIPPGAGDCGAPAAPRSSQAQPPSARRGGVGGTFAGLRRGRFGKGPAAHPGAALAPNRLSRGKEHSPIPNCKWPETDRQAAAGVAAWPGSAAGGAALAPFAMPRQRPDGPARPPGRGRRAGRRRPIRLRRRADWTHCGRWRARSRQQRHPLSLAPRPEKAS